MTLTDLLLLGILIVLWVFLGRFLQDRVVAYLETDPEDATQCLLFVANRGYRTLSHGELYVATEEKETPPSWLAKTWSNPVLLDSLAPGRELRLRLGPKPGPDDLAEAAKARAYITEKHGWWVFIRWVYRLDFETLERMV